MKALLLSSGILALAGATYAADEPTPYQQKLQELEDRLSRL